MAGALEMGLGLLAAGIVAGIGFTLGAMIICRLLKWSPVNIVVNTNVRSGHDGEDLVCGDREGRPDRGGASRSARRCH